MRLRPFAKTHFLLAPVVASFAIATTSAEAQSTVRIDDAGSRTAALAAKLGIARAGAIARSAHDGVRLTAGDNASTPESPLIPYRSTPSPDSAPGGFAMRLPGTGLELTNGSLSIDRANGTRYAKGVHWSVQLTY